jgi:hypothetical protein
MVPGLLGTGKRLFEHLGSERIDLEGVAAPEGVTHLRLRLKR